MSDYISRQAAIDALAKTMPTPVTPDGAGEFDHEIHIADEAFADAIRIIESLEPADVVPVRHGTWLPIVSYNNTYKCSECGRLLVNIADGLNVVAKHYPYCHCGAKMRGEQE